MSASLRQERHAGRSQSAGRAGPTATMALISVAGLLVSLTQSLLIPVLPTLTAYRILFAVSAGAAFLGAAIALSIPAPAPHATMQDEQPAELDEENM